VQESYGKTQKFSSDESQQGDVNAVTDLQKEPPCDWVMFEIRFVSNVRNWRRRSANTKNSATRLKYVVLCKFDQRPLPILVCGEIMDNWPALNHSYFGFHDALRDVSDIG
jgi:hypothetical protein